MMKEGLVNYIFDGDTAEIILNGMRDKLRLAFIDSPEYNAPYGEEAKLFLRQLLPINSIVKLNYIETDQYNRKVCLAYKNDLFINKIMVENGFAVIYPGQFIGAGQMKMKRDLLTSQAQAKRNKLNFWSQQNPIFPWDWRQHPPAPLKGDNK